MLFSKAIFLTLLLCQPQLGNIETIAGTGASKDGSGSGLASQVNVGSPFGVEIGPDGRLYITEVGNHRVRALDFETNRIETIAGCGVKGYSGDGGKATSAKLNEPYEVRFDAAGNMYFVEMQNHLIRKVDTKNKTISTIAGTGEPGFGGDGDKAILAKFKRPHSIALDSHGNIYVADIGNHRIRKIHQKTGRIETFAGNGETKLPVDGETVTGKAIVGPRALYIKDDLLWVALREGHSVWQIDLRTKKIKHIAGTGKKGYSGDDGPPKDATFNDPKGIAVNDKGQVFVVDTENQAIRMIDLSENKIITVAGSGPRKARYPKLTGDNGLATNANLFRPHGICVYSFGFIIGDTESHRVRKVALIRK